MWVAKIYNDKSGKSWAMLLVYFAWDIFAGMMRKERPDYGVS